MGEVDGHKYPDLDADDAIEIADVLVNEYGGEANSEEAFASSIGHSSTSSGAYRSKIADVRKWGVLESRGIEATDLAFKLANPKNNREEQEVRFEMYENVGILRRLYDHLDGKASPSEFWRIIAELTGTDPKTAREVADDLEALYEEMLAIKPETEEDTSDSATPENEDAEIIEETNKQRPPAVESGGVYVQISGDSLDMEEVNDSTLEMARLFIESKKRLHESSPTDEKDGEAEASPEQTTL